jgi:hypothetical protein
MDPRIKECEPGANAKQRQRKKEKSSNVVQHIIFHFVIVSSMLLSFMQSFA